MKTRNSTKSKLLSSVIALVLCVSMLIGATFAWFTDTASTGVNKIQAGNLDMFEVMRGAAMSVRASKGDPSALPSSAALMMATFCGAQAQGRAQECGMLKEGMDADLVLVDFTAPHLMPCHNVLTGLVYAAKGGDVAMTMVRGKILYQNGRFPTIDLNAVVEELTTYAIPKLFAKEENDVE